MTFTDNQCIDSTKAWLSEIVIGWNLCPFARKVFDLQQIRYAVYESFDRYDLLEVIAQEIQSLIDTPREQIETTLLILPNAMPIFADFNDFISDANQLLKNRRWEGVMQIVAFHPLFQFADSQPDDAANYTNRSPSPMIHLLREISVSEVNDHPERLSGIPERNMHFLRKLSLEKIIRTMPK